MLLFILLSAYAVSMPDAADCTVKKAVIDPLECRWTFGNHEPISMYHRAGNRVTGGIEGSALWLEDWHGWFDSEASASLIKELGLNILHSRFYKGMGWQFESKDFPNVKRFVENCHKHNIRVLAYIQFSTLYYETMLSEIPDLADWASVDENGNKRTYHTAYYRWLPCYNSPEFETYLKKMISIAINNGNFDGVMFDNCHAPACYCPRCAALFREYLAREKNPEHRFGLPTVAHVQPPPPRRNDYGEIKDPVYQQWILFRCERVAALYSRLYKHTKSCRPSAIFSGNIQNIRRANMGGRDSLDMANLADAFDLFVSQSGNAPGITDGCIVNRVREMKLARALGTPILALCDEDAGMSSEAETKYFLPLAEDTVFGGIPTDRTVIKPDPKMVSAELVAFRRPLLARFNETVRNGRESLAAREYVPVKVLYSRESILFSELSHRAILSAEEILLRNHVPYALLPTTATKPPEIPSDCEVLLVCDQRCLSEAEINALVQFARRGGKLIVTGESGAYDPFYRQRRDNPLTKALEECKNAVCRNTADAVPVKGAGWTIKVAAPADNGRKFMAGLESLWLPAIRVNAPASVFTEIKRRDNRFYVHFVNYAEKPVDKGSRVEISNRCFGTAKCKFSASLENGQAVSINSSNDGSGRFAFELPAFSTYAVATIDTAKKE